MKQTLPIRFKPSAVSSIVALSLALSSSMSFAQEALERLQGPVIRSELNTASPSVAVHVTATLI